ncbi:MAG: globin family protein [Rhodobacterales bacterium]|nr:MAG: globin family protein [Rhodobacterales bacterium]
MADLPPRFPVTSAQIDQVMQVFYASVRHDQTLGPIFERHIGTDAESWDHHIAKISRFWHRGILHEGEYSGNPMTAHTRAGDIYAHHFDIWLALFDRALAQVLPAEPAAQWSALAHRMGRGLRMGVKDINQPEGAVPDLS